MKGHKYNVAVAGTHGKTTSTSMITNITLKGNLDPTILVGGELDIIGETIELVAVITLLLKHVNTKNHS